MTFSKYMCVCITLPPEKMGDALRLSTFTVCLFKNADSPILPYTHCAWRGNAARSRKPTLSLSIQLRRERASGKEG